MVQKLCQYGADLNRYRWKYNACCGKETLSIVCIMYPSCMFVDCFRRTTYGITPPMMACELGLMDLMAAMLHVDQHQHNVKPLDPNIQDECGATMLINAVKRRNGELCKMILSSATYHQVRYYQDMTCYL